MLSAHCNTIPSEHLISALILSKEVNTPGLCFDYLRVPGLFLTLLRSGDLTSLRFRKILDSIRVPGLL